jgi:hypothetical protein
MRRLQLQKAACGLPATVNSPDSRRMAWHHHITLVCLAYVFLLLERRRLKKTPVLTLPEARRYLQMVLIRMFGVYPVCHHPAGRSAMAMVADFRAHRERPLGPKSAASNMRAFISGFIIARLRGALTKDPLSAPRKAPGSPYQGGDAKSLLRAAALKQKNP